MSGGRVGPIIFGNETARGFLERHGHVYTFRTGTRTTGKTHVRYERTGEKQYDALIQTYGKYDGPRLELALDRLAPDSGFGTGPLWREAIEEIHGEVPDEGAIYLVIKAGGSE